MLFFCRLSIAVTLILPKSQQVFALQQYRPFSNTPHTWKQLKDIIENKKDLSLLTRSEKEEQKYVSYKNEIHTHWQSVVDHILCTKFKFKKCKVTNHHYDDSTITWKAHPSLSEITTVKLALCVNEFPYTFEDNVEHWVLWKTLEQVTEEDISEAKQTLMDKMDGEVDDMLHWMNPLQLKSIPEIEHCHIIVKRS